MTSMRARARRLSGLLAMAVLVPTLLTATATTATSAAGDPSMPVAGELSTNAVNTSSISIPVPSGVTPTAVTAVVTQSAVVPGGNIVFTINGAPVVSVASALYQKVSIPVDTTNVTASGTIDLALASQGPAVAGQACIPVQGAAAVRKIALEYTGAETAPTTVGTFFGPTAARVDVVIPSDASSALIEAGLTAVDALAARYDDKTPIELTSQAPDGASGVATQRIVSLVSGRAGEVTTAVSATGTIPTLTLTGTGAELVDAARSLSSEALSMGGGSDTEDPSTQMKARSTSTTRTLSSLGVTQLDLNGYGSTTERFQVKQDDFGSPVDGLRLHLEGSHTAFAATAGARLDVRANGNLVGSTSLGSGSDVDLDVTVPSSRLQSVNDIDVTLSALSPTGLSCTSASEPTASVDLNTQQSTVQARRGTGSVEGFQLFPQVLRGTLPVAIQGTGQDRIRSAIDAANLIVALQRAAASQLDISVVAPDAFLADNRSGLIVGAVAQDSVNLDAPLRLSSTRRLRRADSDFAVTSQDPYAALESIDRDNRFVLMLGSWAPGNVAASGALSRKVSDAVVASEWDGLTGDLFIADASTPAFNAASQSLRPHTVVTKQRSYAGYFVAAIILLLVLLAAQVVLSVRRDRARARAKREAEVAERRGGPAFVEDDDAPAPDDLGDLDDLEVTTATGTRPAVTPKKTTAPAKKTPTPPAAKKASGRQPQRPTPPSRSTGRNGRRPQPKKRPES